METSDLLGEPILILAELRCAMMEYGAQCVAVDGLTQMLLWFAGNWDSVLQVRNKQRVQLFL